MKELGNMEEGEPHNPQRPACSRPYYRECSVARGGGSGGGGGEGGTTL